MFAAVAAGCYGYQWATRHMGSDIEAEYRPDEKKSPHLRKKTIQNILNWQNLKPLTKYINQLIYLNHENQIFILAALCMATISIYAQNFNGLDMNMGNLYRLSNAKTRSISPENFTGEKKGGMADPITDKEKINQANAHHAAKTLGQGWKVNPYVNIGPNETFTLAEIEGPGSIQTNLDDTNR